MVTSVTINITIRDLDEETYRKAKGKASEEKKRIGQVVSEALALWLDHKKRPKKGKAILDWIEKPRNWGMKTNASDIDRFIYQ